MTKIRGGGWLQRLFQFSPPPSYDGQSDELLTRDKAPKFEESRSSLADRGVFQFVEEEHF